MTQSASLARTVDPPRRGIAADSGELDELCARHNVRILTVFGSAAHGEPKVRDLDIGAMFEPDADIDYLAIIGDLMDLTAAEVDFVHLNRGGPVIRERALVGSITAPSPCMRANRGLFRALRSPPSSSASTPTGCVASTWS